MAALLLAAGGLWLVAADGDYRTIARALLRGLWTTVYVTLSAFALAFAFGTLLALARRSASRALSQAAIFYIEIMRGLPVLVLLFYMAFVGAPALVDALNWALAPILSEPIQARDFGLVWRAVLALALAYAAFIAEILRAGIEAVPQGQIEAGRALGLRERQIFLRVVAPQALRIALPALANDFIAMIKDSALVSALGVQDITQLGKVYSASTFLFFETYNVVAYLYLVMTVSLSLATRRLEARLSRSDTLSQH